MMTRRRQKLLLKGLVGILLVIPVSLPGQQDTPTQATVTLITGQQTPVQLDSLVDGSLHNAGQPIPLESLARIETGREFASSDENLQVFLSAGGQLKASRVTFDGEQFRLQAGNSVTGNPEWVLPPEAIRGILFDDSADLSRFQRALENRSVEQDVVIVKTAESQAIGQGLIASMDESKLILNRQGESGPISLSRLVGLVTADLQAQPPAGQIGSVQLANGSTLTAGIAGLESGLFTLNLPGGGSLQVPLSDVVAISLQSDRVLYLSDLEPLEVSCNPLATPGFTWQRDRSVRGNPLRLVSPSSGKVSRYPKGIGTHSACRLEFSNPGGFDRFSATVGIDAETEGKGDCQVSVWADGIKLWEAEVRGGEEPLQVDADIRGMQRVALVVNHGRHLDLGDHVNWADARFLKLDP